jgi:septal ring factor EnvC (AmiA/AmiB activator)
VDVNQIVDEEKMRKIFKEIAEINKRLESVNENDRKLQRMLKELDMNNLIKMIKFKY